jgi:hypothetical protein
MIGPCISPEVSGQIPNNNVNFRSNIRSLLSCHGGYGKLGVDFAELAFQFRPVCRSGSRWEPSNEGKRGVLSVIFSFLTDGPEGRVHINHSEESE